MNRRIKVFGLALVAALALTAVMASVASAQFTSNKEHTIFSGSQAAFTNDIFSAGEGFGGITCENATFSGTGTTLNDADRTIIPTYSNCKDSFGRTVDIDDGEVFYDEIGIIKIATPCCELRFTLTSGGGGSGSAHLSGKFTFTVTSAGSVICTVVIKSGQKISGISYINRGGTSGFDVITHATNVISTTSGGFFNCGVSNGEHFSGTYDGDWAITGKDTAGNTAEVSID
jgi:hypothetical protein